MDVDALSKPFPMKLLISRENRKKKKRKVVFSGPNSFGCKAYEGTEHLFIADTLALSKNLMEHIFILVLAQE